MTKQTVEIKTDPSWWGKEGESPMTGSAVKRDNQDMVLQWLLTPSELREPKTKRALAEALGVTERTLYNYLSEPSLQRKLANERSRIGRVERAQDVIDALYARSLQEDSPSAANAAAKLWLEFTFRGLEEREALDMTAMTDDEVMASAVKVIEALSKKHQ